MLPLLLVGLYGGLKAASVVVAVDYVVSQFENVRAKSVHAIYPRKDKQNPVRVEVYTAHEFKLLHEGHTLFHKVIDKASLDPAYRDPVAELASDIEDSDARDLITRAVGEAWVAAQAQPELFRWARLIDAQQATD
jgi:hypothetical protein